MVSQKSSRISFFLISLCCLVGHVAWTQTLYGYVYEQNSGKKPVKDVMVKSTFANQVSTDNKGSFTLQFQNGKPGAAVLLNAEKQNWVITDKERLKVNLPDDPYKQPPVIILCRQDVWNKMNTENRALIGKTIATQYEKKLAALNKKAKDYSTRADSLWQQFTKMQEELSKYAEALSSTNLDEVSEVERKAYALFKEGKLEECLKLRTSLKSEENLKKAVDEKQQLEKAVANKDSVIALHKRNLKEEARIAQLKYDWSTAEQKLAAIAKIDTMDFDARFEFAGFIREQNQFNKAQIEYEKLLVIYQRLAENNPNVYDYNLAKLQNDLGNLYDELNDYTSAEKAYLKAQETLIRLAKTDLNKYEPDLGINQNNLGVLYIHKEDIASAEKAFKLALEIRETLAQKDPEIYGPDIASTQMNLGGVYVTKKDYVSAENILEKSLEVFTRLAQKNPLLYQPDMAMTYNHLGNMYSDNNNYVSAENAYKFALNIFTYLTNYNPAAYETEIAMMQFNLGNLYSNNNDFNKAENAYKQALEIYTNNAKTHPAKYESNLAFCQNNLGVLYYEKKDLSLAEKYFKAALETRKVLYRSNSNLYKSKLESSINNLFMIFQAQKKSAKNINEKLTIQQKIVTERKVLVTDEKFIDYENDLGNEYGNLAWYLILSKRFSEAEKAARTSLFPDFTKTVEYDKEVEWANANLALSLLLQGKYSEAEKIYLTLKNKSNGDATFKSTFLADLDEMEKNGITHKDFEKIRTLLNQ